LLSRQLLSLNGDLARLVEEGFNVEIVSNHLVLNEIPYVDSDRQIRQGRLISTLHMSGESTLPPDTHVVYLEGLSPCKSDGTPLRGQSPAGGPITEGLVANFQLSEKPSVIPNVPNYADYHHKMTTYVAILEREATKIDATVTGRTFPTIGTTEGDNSPFQYLDTASSRAGISFANKKLALEKVAIIGVGGTGSYVLDLVAKTEVKEIHIFDGDRLYSHNAFRSPGAASLEQLNGRPTKVEYYRDQYIKIHKDIIAHPTRLTEDSIAELAGMNFVFLCIDNPVEKLPIVNFLEYQSISFIDVGMGLYQSEHKLGGILRVSLSTPDDRDSLRAVTSFESNTPENDYHTDIQVADLNALNAALAVVRWKMHLDFYFDYEKTSNLLFTLDTNTLIL
jgi:hypothetical protein